VGQGAADLAEKELPKDVAHWFEMNVEQRGDEHGCYRPCAISATPGWFNDGMGGHYRDGTDLAVVAEAYRKSCENYTKGRMGEAEAKRFMEQHSAPGRYPAYQSVEIYLSKKPTKDLHKVMVERAEHFCRNFPTLSRFGERDPIPYTGCRLLEKTTRQKLVEVTL